MFEKVEEKFEFGLATLLRQVQKVTYFDRFLTSFFNTPIIQIKLFHVGTSIKFHYILLWVKEIGH